MTRITQQGRTAGINADLQLAGSRLSKIQRQVASGRQIERPSDAPAVALEALRYRRTLRTYGQYDRNLDDAKNWLGSADSALQAVDSRIRRAQDLTIQAENGALSPTARQAIAVELRSIADELVDLANTEHLDRPIFSGTSGASAAYQTDGTYLGDAGTVSRTISSGTTVQVNLTGEEIFGASAPADPANGNLFEFIRSVADDIDAGVSVGAALTGFSAAQDRVHTAQAALGSRLGTVERVENRNLDVSLDLNSSLSKVEDVDLSQAIVQLRADEASYQAALGITGRILQNSLLDFLR